MSLMTHGMSPMKEGSRKDICRRERPEDDDRGGGDYLLGLLERHGLLGASSRRALLEWRARGRRTSAFCACEFQKTGWPRDFGADPAPSGLYTTDRAVQICRGNRTRTRGFLCAPPLPASTDAPCTLRQEHWSTHATHDVTFAPPVSCARTICGGG